MRYSVPHLVIPVCNSMLALLPLRGSVLLVCICFHRADWSHWSAISFSVTQIGYTGLLCFLRYPSWLRWFALRRQIGLAGLHLLSALTRTGCTGLHLLSSSRRLA
jgi:hypothetical protein